VERLREQAAACQSGAESEVLLLQHTLEHECVEKARLRASLANAQLDRCGKGWEGLGRVERHVKGWRAVTSGSSTAESACAGTTR